MTSSQAVVTRISEFPSKEVLLECLRQSTALSCLLGRQAESPQKFFCIELQDSSGRKSYVGIYSHGIGLAPGWRHADGRLFVGFNDRIAILILDSLSLQQEIPLLSLFWEFLEAPQTPLVCVLCETAIVALRADGSLVWRRDTERITGSRVVDAILYLDFDTDSSMRIDLRTGENIP